jgi:xylulokinase
MYLLGYDIGSSSVKAALVDADSGKTVVLTHSPNTTMPISTLKYGWAEQDPEMWWTQVCAATQQLLKTSGVDPSQIRGIGIAYQMHGLVCVDRNQKVLRPAIIWCDSRAVEIGDRAFTDIGGDQCLTHLLNSPANFTASKLKWVMENEPSLYAQIYHFMLPGDYIAMKLTGQVQTTASGLSEGILWDFLREEPAAFVMDYFGFDHSLIPEIVSTVSLQAKVTSVAAKETGLAAGTPICYRAGDQPNNAMALGVLNPGEVAATGGTSGVLYGVTDRPVADFSHRVNSFLHVNHNEDAPRLGVLLCINGAGIMHDWIRTNVGPDNLTYQDMETAATNIPIGSDGLLTLPFGNGAERMLGNVDPGARFINLQLNRHKAPHLYRASLEGIAFAFAYGAQILQDMDIASEVIRVGNDNLFRSRIFSETVANVLQVRIEIHETTGAVGAARAAGVEAGAFASLDEVVQGSAIIDKIEPLPNGDEYEDAYIEWLGGLGEIMDDEPEDISSLN